MPNCAEVVITSHHKRYELLLNVGQPKPYKSPVKEAKFHLPPSSGTSYLHSGIFSFLSDSCTIKIKTCSSCTIKHTPNSHSCDSCTIKLKTCSSCLQLTIDSL